MGYLDEEGYLYLTDRKANMIISGGVNIYPQEAENVLISHPKVADVAVFGVPSESFGEEVKAVVELVSFADASPDLAQELILFCREHLSKLKCPRSIDFEERLPRAENGKLYKRRLKERYWKGHETRIL
jgi:acyl-CoA synthetase (AMP-forming)/AMP-acid ligase II